MVEQSDMFVFTDTNCHIAVLGAEVDNVSPPELVKQFEEVLSTKPEVKNIRLYCLL